MKKEQILISVCAIAAIALVLSGCASSTLEKYHDSIVSNPNFCTKLGPDSDKCFSYAAMQKREIGMCERIQMDSIREECKANLQETVLNPSRCAGMGNILAGEFEPRAKCYEEFALKTNNSDTCEQVSQTDEECEALRIYTKGDTEEVVMFNRLIKECKEERVLRRNMCVSRLAAQRKHAALCDSNITQVQGFPDYVPFCYDRVAVEKDDVSLCKHIDCVAAIAVSRKDPQVCLSIDDMQYSAIMKRRSWDNVTDPAITLNRSKAKSDCVAEAASRAGQIADGKICLEIIKEQPADRRRLDCINKAANQTSEIKACELIEAIPDKKMCEMDEQGEATQCTVPSLFNSDENELLACAVRIAGAHGYERCAELGDEKYRNECLFRVSAVNGTEEPCKLISTGVSQMGSCAEYAGHIVKSFGEKGYSIGAEYAAAREQG